ncbi:MAG: GYD domain-containing protein [Solirubrobacteraceae bacterium]
MPKYLVQSTYTREGVEGIRSKGGTARREAIIDMAKSLGGEVESYYFGFGEYDVLAILDLPDDEAAAAVALAVDVAGTATAKTTVLLTPEQIDEAVRRTADYRPPGS